MNPAASAKPPDRVIAPSLLACDHAHLADGARRAEAAGADWLHVDIMDGHFVDNFSFGAGAVSGLREAVNLYLDVHLMITRPDRYWESFAKAGAGGITVHLEAEHDVLTTLQGIRDGGLKAGLALKPGTPLSEAEPFLNELDLLLVMTVEPGFGGQAFRRDTLPKIAAAAEARARRGLSFHIEVDGGIELSTGRETAAAGANVLAAGTSLFQAADMAAAIRALREV